MLCLTTAAAQPYRSNLCAQAFLHEIWQVVIQPTFLLHGGNGKVGFRLLSCLVAPEPSEQPLPRLGVRAAATRNRNEDTRGRALPEGRASRAADVAAGSVAVGMC